MESMGPLAPTEGLRLNDHARKTVAEGILLHSVHLEIWKVSNQVRGPKGLPEGTQGLQDEWETVLMALQLS